MLMGDRLSTRLPHHSPRISNPRPRHGILWYFVAIALWSGGSGRLARLVPALHPTGSHCTESSVPTYPVQNGLPKIITLASPRSVTASYFDLFFAARPMLLASAPFSPPGAR